MNKHFVCLGFAAIIALAGVVSAGDYSGGGAGTEADPYRIATAADMNEIGAHPNDWDKHFVVVNDINLADYTGTEFNIIGKYSPWNPFTGTFDGNGHTISNFTYTIANTYYIGLFGYIYDSNAVIKNLTLVDPNVNATGGSDYVGCLVGCLGSGMITGCGIDGGRVSGWSRPGGLVGHNYGTISNCYATGSVTGTNYYPGGLVGNNWGTISNCYAEGSVTGNNWTGGLVGSNGGMISNCYATGSVAGDGYTGGLVGRGSGGWAVNCFWDVNTTGQSQSAGGVGKTTAEMKAANTFFGWASCGSEDAWTIDEGKDYPRLSWQNLPGQLLPVQQLCDFLTGSGTATDSYIVYTAEELNLIGLFTCEWDKHFILAADIDLSVYADTQFNNIGRKGIPFTGVFDGNGHTISNFTYETNADYTGLFGYVDDANALIKDLTLVTPDVNAAGISNMVGCLAGKLRYGTITGCGIDGGSVTGIDCTGGLVGYNRSGTISNCYAASSVTGTGSTGGLAGYNYGGTISNCCAAGSVTGGELSRCHTGGLVGGNYDGMISNCYSAGDVTGGDGTGGLVGYNYYGTVSNSFWDVNSSGQDTSAGGEGKTTEQMQTRATFTDASWDFVGEIVNGPNDIWRMCVDGLNYPMLWWEFIDGDFVCPDGVDFIDYSFFAGHWLEDNCAGSNDCEGSDLDQSGAVDIGDLKILGDNWLEGLIN